MRPQTSSPEVPGQEAWLGQTPVTKEVRGAVDWGIKWF